MPDTDTPRIKYPSSWDEIPIKGLDEFSVGTLAAAEEIEKTLEVVTESTVEQANAFLTLVHRLHKEIDSMRAKLKRPLLDGGKAIDKAFKPTLTKLDSLKASMKAKLTAYVQEVERQQRELEHARFDESEQTETESGLPPEIQPGDVDVPMKTHGVKVRRSQVVEIVDASALPREYLVPNMALIEDHLRQNIAVPGARLVESTSVTA